MLARALIEKDGKAGLQRLSNRLLIAEHGAALGLEGECRWIERGHAELGCGCHDFDAVAFELQVPALLEVENVGVDDRAPRLDHDVRQGDGAPRERRRVRPLERFELLELRELKASRCL